MQGTRLNASRVGAAYAKLSTSTALPPPATTTVDYEQIKRDFYATYDVMTGIRIAATLGGFFSLMVVLIVYKSKSKTQKALNDPHLAAVAAEAVAEAEADLHEEEMALQAALEATAAWSMNPRAARHARQSLGNMSAPAMWARSPRFSSVGGGYGNLMTPPTRAYGKSLPGSALRFHTQPSCAEDDDDDAFDEVDDFQFLSVNKRNYRRCSNITCSSSDSSYLERRGSAVVGLPPPPALPSGRRRSSAERCWDFYYPIDIQVIQPTPDMSPSGSERMLYDTVPGATSGLVVPPRLAPLATISSCASSVLGTELADLDQRSVGSDSVFMDDVYYDTDDEITQFSTDSEENYAVEDARVSRHKQHSWKRRSSAPVQRRTGSFIQQRLIKNSESINLLNSRSESSRLLNQSAEDIQLTCREAKSAQVLNRIEETSLKNDTPVRRNVNRPPCPLPDLSTTSDTSTLLAAADHLSEEAIQSCSHHHLPTTMPLLERSPSHRINKSSSLINLELGSSRSQETLF